MYKTNITLSSIEDNQFDNQLSDGQSLLFLQMILRARKSNKFNPKYYKFSANPQCFRMS